MAHHADQETGGERASQHTHTKLHTLVITG